MNAIAQQKIDGSYLLSSASWGGSRCPDCGLAIEPRQLIQISGWVSGDGVRVHLDGSYAAHGRCVPAEDWEDRAIKRIERRQRYLQRTC